MKLDDFIIITKGAAFMLVGIFTPWSAALAQWINSDIWPSRIIWVGIILPASVVGGATSWIAFTSGSWKEYRQQKLANAMGTDQVTTVKPQVPVTPAEEIKT